ncbi:gastrula zinc finger protein XlCGF52.1 [Folsomia candida]|uniref:gastrula zinc finger protein XlCGF52.1 n=1 Tax=Folsomia candida TaxID=158441 RepID=UPI00160538EE|nr:gastrula zinc finger protein XlCGF52.1 [Folsomia candida]
MTSQPSASNQNPEGDLSNPKLGGGDLRSRSRSIKVKQYERKKVSLGVKSKENNNSPLDRKRCSNRPKKKVVLQKVAVKTTSKNVKKIKNRKILICPSPYCEKSFVAEYTLNYHIARHHHIPCPESGCSAKFGSEKEKRAHIKDAHGTKVAPKTSSHPDHDHVCHICRKKFISNDSLRSHVRRRHDESKRPQCETCGEKFLHESTLQSHRVREHGADHLVCEECGAIFSSQLGLRQHKWRHSGIKPHKCEQCGASFSIKRDLDLHLSSHSSQRQDPCLHCDLVFKNKEQVRAHVKRIHTVGYVTPTPHKCAQCGKSFQYPVHLRAHVLQVHTGERPFICAQCGKGFASKSLLSVHLKRKCGGDVVPVKKDRLPRSKRDSFQEEEVDC